MHVGRADHATFARRRRSTDQRGSLCWFGHSAPWASEGLQGQLIHELTAMLEGPDVPVRTWLARESVPLGIHKVIEPGGVFPPASNKNDDALLDDWFHVDKYSTSEPYREGAEEILRREIGASWREWVATSKELGRRYGIVTYSRIGVVAKQKLNGLKLRLMHDLRRSGVNARVQLSEGIVLPRLNDARNDILDHIEQVGEYNWECIVLVLPTHSSNYS